ncbi:MAG: 5-oxoprolinase/urea amidolyase family protein [Rhodospirillales bacterium]|nr:5-oxoprolinase/urea amidolyase family protein [Rhodospirillales bacterium]
MRILPVNRHSFMVELQNLEETQGLLHALRENAMPGVEEIIPAARTLLLRFTPEIVKAEVLAGQITRLDIDSAPPPDGPLVEVPVLYDGEDLPEVSALTGLSVAEIIRRHGEAEYLVAFCGFAPGFGYLVGGNAALAVPRRKTPRTRIPAGAVALAGEFTGVYPRASPGGWQLIGTTPLKMWDLSRNPPAYFQPGYRVRFVNLASAKREFSIPAAPMAEAPEAKANAVQFTILAAPLPALLQDLGRFGEARQGVSISGALDRSALKSANRLVGNDEATACLELTAGISFRSNGAAVIGLAGAPRGIRLCSAAGQVLRAEPYAPIALEAGDEITLTNAEAGMCSYLAVRGGFKIEKTLGSASRDTLSEIGPEPVGAGRVLAVREAANLTAVSLHEASAFVFPKQGETVTLDLTLGPRADWFTEEALELLANTDWQVTPQSNRIGLRLNAATSLARIRMEELPSEAVVRGAVQVPTDGKPLLFLADHPLTGGYPVIGVVTEYHLNLAGQIPVGAKIRFRPIAPFQDITP